MAELNRRLTNIERIVEQAQPDQANCQCCHNSFLYAFEDEPENTGPKGPYAGPNGTCCLCRMPPPAKRILKLPAGVAEFFATVPWSDEPCFRFLEKMEFMQAAIRGDWQKVEEVVKRLLRNDANGSRHRRFEAFNFGPIKFVGPTVGPEHE